MKKILADWRAFRQEYGLKKIVDAMAGGLLFAALIFLPIFLALVQFLIIYMYLKEVWFSLLFLAAMGFVLTASRLTSQALILKKPDHSADVSRLLWIHALADMGVIFLLGIVFVVFILPLIWV